LQPYQHQFIQLAIEQGALTFGEFTLKSGRISPYFFNIGTFHSGKALAQLGTIYANAMMQHNIDCDMIFGPAYKGICLAASTAIACYNDFDRDIPYAFNRKEAKDHGEGGQLVGAPLIGNVLIIDDVITAGTAVKETMSYIQQANANCAGIIVALDRQERGQHKESAIALIEKTYNTSVYSIIQLHDIIAYISQDARLKQHVTAINAYRDQFRVD